MPGTRTVSGTACAAALTISLAGATAPDVAGQPHYANDPPVGCGGCRVVVELVAEITGDETGGANLVGAFDPHRRLLVTTNSDWRDRVFAYEIPEYRGTTHRITTPTWRFGREGDGPGEFRNVVALAFMADTLVVGDHGARRLTLLSPERDVVRTLRVDGALKLRSLAAAPGRIVAYVASPDDPAAPVLADLDPVSGDERHRSGRRAGWRELGHAITISPRRNVALAPDGTLLATWPESYFLDRYAPDGTTLGQSRRVLDWFPLRAPADVYGVAARRARRASSEGEMTLETMPVEPAVNGIWVDPDRGWIGVGLAVPQRPVGPGPGAHAGRVEFWDPEAREVLIAADAPLLWAQVGAGYWLTVEEDEIGRVTLQLWRVRVEG